MSTNSIQQDVLPTEPEADQPEQETQKQKQDRILYNKQYKAYINEQIIQLKPTVELAELKARYSKATYENYAYSIKLHEIQNEQQQKVDQEATPNSGTKVEDASPEPTTGTPVINMNQTQSVDNAGK
jgi:hypothetical protein